MEEQWLITRKSGRFQEIAEELNISPVMARLMCNREIKEDDMKAYLTPDLKNLHNGLLMKDMDKAISIITDKIQDEKAIRIIGDYDIDGITSTYILLEALEGLGAVVDYDIPDRIENGYGLSRTLIEKALADGIDTILTCDNGIAARDEIAFAKEQGMTVVITDHHEVPYVEVQDNDKIVRKFLLPEADAVVDPKQEDCHYPFDELCGAAVAYKLTEQLYISMGRDFAQLDYLLGFVAIATIGDVMDLVGENRIFVKEGIKRLHVTNNQGMKSLMEVNEIEPKDLSTYHIGFVLGPCMNASGRLDSAKKAIQLFREKDYNKAYSMAAELKSINDERKDLTAIAVEQAMVQVQEELSGHTVLVVYLPDCHESIAGIIAGRVREKFYKPAIVMTNAESGIKGSGRSIEEYHLFEELTKCKDLLNKFGGHKLAAGLSMPLENLEILRARLNELHSLSENDLTPKVRIDMQMPLAYTSLELVEELKKLEPSGKGNRKALFVERDVEVSQVRIMGKNQNVLKCKLRHGGFVVDGLMFGEVQSFVDTIIEKYGQSTYDSICKGQWNGVKMSMVYIPELNEFRGNRTLQLRIQNYK